ncbi:flagellar MS-ring protein [Alkalihalophilus pseudofirmus OF4]|uniref:Flagellar M-ring protein n=1 Tax=Alkalihalophilus pseudofirmus (strain ATCC BAA-2126 / JCM 17055 / OF4) TaxID=398511 RepID=D3FT40_ALKPO|nr:MULTISPECIES: flagellar basal-body MS-ring/collar protein FliF [Alkalihalophilus]ADC48108.1 flagellar MS-ring protein [Alkalihalophilus pseudofirmus OF4]MED1602285.1 flagellar basal-body MS-ring/collar protein FliF [Alkalihalophilus marmarensis]
MNEKFVLYKQKVTEFWSGRTKKQKSIYAGAFIAVALLLILLLLLGNRSNNVPLYSNLTLQETGQIKETLDARGIPAEISDNGTTILVPEAMVDSLKVDLAAEGIPRSGSIDYSFFQDQMGFGMTDNEFSVMERGLMQTELQDLIRNINGVNHANVMITLPEESVWLNTTQEAATASIVVDLAPGYQLDQNQVKALYHLVSKSVPNLPIENIVIMNQMFEDYFYDNDGNQSTTLSAFEQQRTIQREIERDLTLNLQRMLGTVVGQDKVLVSVTTDIDFTQENRQESLVEPVDPENIEGIAVSIERVTETYTGEGTPAGGVEGTGEGIPNFPGAVGQGESEYERTEDRINNEVNRINRDIVESPYKIRDLGIQVMVEPPEGMDVLPQERLDDIQQILGTIVRTSISGVYADELTEAGINEKIYVSSQPFEGKPDTTQAPLTVIPVWMYVVAGVLVVIIILLIVLLMRKRKQEEEEELVIQQQAAVVPDLPDEDTGESATKRKQLERMAKEKPEEFSKLLRTWLSED